MQSTVSSNWSLLPRELSTELLSHTTPCHLKAGQTLFEIGDEGNGCYLLDRGALKVTLTSGHAGERIVSILRPGAVVGDLSMIDGLPRSASVTALTACELRFISRKHFQQIVEAHPEIYRDLANVLAGRLRDCDNQVAAQTFLPMKSRVARALLELAESFGSMETPETIVLSRHFTQSDLAALAGVARETANRIMNEWERMGILSKTSQNYKIDNARLRREI